MLGGYNWLQWFSFGICSGLIDVSCTFSRGKTALGEITRGTFRGHIRENLHTAKYFDLLHMVLKPLSTSAFLC